MNRWLALVLLLLLAASGAAYAAIAVGDPAPQTGGKDTEGSWVNLQDHRGKVVVMTFWASWCPYCLQELPILENLQKRAGKDRISVIAVNVDKNKADYRQVLKRMKAFQLTVTTDEKRELSKAFNVSALPHMVLIDKQGKISSIHLGYSEKMLPKFVDEINALLEAP